MNAVNEAKKPARVFDRIATIATYFGELRVSILPVGGSGSTERRLILSEVYKDTVGKVRDDAGTMLVLEPEDIDAAINALLASRQKMGLTAPFAFDPPTPPTPPTLENEVV